MNNPTLEYITKWEKELEKINGDALIDYFHRFQTLYPIYNRLYTDANRIENLNSKNQNRVSDYTMATIFVRDYLGSDTIIKALEEQDQIKDVIAISKLIQNKVFHINLKDGNGQEKFDMELVQKLLNEKDFSIRSRAVLSVIYNVRCNLVHGQKRLEEHQRLLLEPVQNLLRTIVSLMKDRLQ
jgi:hypothetical protein